MKLFQGEAHLYLIIFALSGLVLILVSTQLDEHFWRGIPYELVKELGIVLVAVSTMSLVYELYLAKKYHAAFMTDLREEIRKGEGNAAACAHLGIEEIYAQRWKFISAYSIDEMMKYADRNSRLRIFARSAHNLLSERAHVFNDALMRGAEVHLCILDPNCNDEDLALTSDVYRHDLESAIYSLRHHLIPIMDGEKPPGRLEVHFHRVPMLDSFLEVVVPGRHICAWDLSFGRKTEDKHIFRVDPNKPIGRELLARYEHVWKNSPAAYVWANGAERENNL